MKKACLLGLMQFLIPLAVYMYLLWPRLESPLNIFIPGFLAIFMMISIGLIWHAVNRVQDLSIIRAATGSVQKQDGKRTAVFGRIQPYGEPLKTPTGSECVCCVWGVYIMIRGSGKSGSQKAYKGRGNVLTPSYVRTSLGDVRLLAFPHLEGFPMELIGFEEASREKWDHAVGYMNGVPRNDPMGPLDIKKAFREVESMMTDSDGTVQTEWRQFDLPEMEGHTIEEQYVPPGAEVCLTGRWNASVHGIVPEEIGSGKEVVLRKGTPEEVTRSLRSSIIGRAVGGLILGIAVNVIVWLILEKIPLQ